MPFADKARKAEWQRQHNLAHPENLARWRATRRQKEIEMRQDRIASDPGFAARVATDKRLKADAALGRTDAPVVVSLTCPCGAVVCPAHPQQEWCASCSAARTSERWRMAYRREAEARLTAEANLAKVAIASGMPSAQRPRATCFSSERTCRDCSATFLGYRNVPRCKCCAHRVKRANRKRHYRPNPERGRANLEMWQARRRAVRQIFYATSRRGRPARSRDDGPGYSASERWRMLRKSWNLVPVFIYAIHFSCTGNGDL